MWARFLLRLRREDSKRLLRVSEEEQYHEAIVSMTQYCYRIELIRTPIQGILDGSIRHETVLDYTCVVVRYQYL